MYIRPDRPAAEYRPPQAVVMNGLRGGKGGGGLRTEMEDV